MTTPDANFYEGREAVMFDLACDAQDRGEHFFYVRIPEDIKPLERGERFEDALQVALDEASAGDVTGGGSQLGEGDSIEYCGIDVVMKDAASGLEFLRRELRRLGVPSGTVIEQYLPDRIDHPVHDEVDGEPVSGGNR